MYSFSGRVRYSETDHLGKLNEAAVVNYLQDCSTFQSEEAGAGVAFLKENRRVWVLNSWNIIFEKEIYLGENLIISTWPSGFRGLLANRDYTICGAGGETYIRASSIWALINLDTGHPEKIGEDMRKYYHVEEPLDMPTAGRKIKMPMEMKPEKPFSVRRADLDSNGHVNNAKYIVMAAEYLPEGFRTYQLRAEYRRSAHYRDDIFPSVKEQDGTFFIALCGRDGSPYANLSFAQKPLAKNEAE